MSYISIIGTPGKDCELENILIDMNKSGFRLPTEAEWEYSCRAGSSTSYFWGKNYYPYPQDVLDSNEIDLYVVWKRNSYNKGFGNPGYGSHAVAGKLPNAYGLYDMAGNVWEWVNDWYSAPSSAPAQDPTGPFIGSSKLIMGGSWELSAVGIRSSNSGGGGPGGFSEFVGFRVCMPNR